MQDQCSGWGTEGSVGGCGRPASGGLSFSVTKSVVTKHLVDVTSPHIARDSRGQRTDGRKSFKIVDRFSRFDTIPAVTD